MFGLGPLLRAAKGVAKTVSLNDEIKLLELHLAKSPPDRYKGSQRFTAKVTLEGARHLAWLEGAEGRRADREAVLAKARRSHRRLVKVYEEEVSAMTSEPPVSKAELIALALVVKELALELEGVKATLSSLDVKTKPSPKRKRPARKKPASRKGKAPRRPARERRGEA